MLHIFTSHLEVYTVNCLNLLFRTELQNMFLFRAALAMWAKQTPEPRQHNKQ